jgi:hypothetical protein
MEGRVELVPSPFPSTRQTRQKKLSLTNPLSLTSLLSPLHMHRAGQPHQYPDKKNSSTSKKMISTTIFNNSIIISTITHSFLYKTLDLSICLVRFKVYDCRARSQLSVAVLITSNQPQLKKVMVFFVGKGTEKYRNYCSIIHVRLRASLPAFRT